MIWIEIAGWAGMVLLLVNFFLASSQRLNDTRYPYHFLNFLGSLGVMVNAANKGVWPVTLVEVAWSLIAIFGIANVYRHSRRAS